LNDLLLWKLVHVLAGSIVFGTGLGIAFFTWFGCRQALARRSIEALRTILDLAVIADWCFTAVAIVVQFAAALMLLHLHGWSFTSPWATAAFALYALTGACWIPVVAIQIRQRNEARAAASTEALSPAFHRRFRIWVALGIPAFAAVIALFALMLLKPAALPIT
jgi:uncharacterized membrane protein